MSGELSNCFTAQRSSAMPSLILCESNCRTREDCLRSLLALVLPVLPCSRELSCAGSHEWWTWCSVRHSATLSEAMERQTYPERCCLARLTTTSCSATRDSRSRARWTCQATVTSLSDAPICITKRESRSHTETEIPTTSCQKCNSIHTYSLQARTQSYYHTTTNLTKTLQSLNLH